MLLAVFIHVKTIKTINLNDLKLYLQCIYIKKLIKGWPVLRAYNGFNPAMPAPDQFQSHTKYTFIKSPKQRWDTYCFCSVSSYYYYYYSPFFFFLSADHELVHGRSQELLDRIS